MTLDIVWNIFGWVAFALNVWGNWALTTKGLRGWIIRIACNLCWMPYGIYTRSWALLANHLLFIVINCHGLPEVAARRADGARAWRCAAGW
jgi:hypothetical protein